MTASTIIDAFEKEIGKIDSIEEITGSRNKNFLIKQKDSKFMLKLYPENKRGSFITETWMYETLDSNVCTKKLIKSGYIEFIGNFIVTELYEGETLKKRVEINLREIERKFITLQVINLIQSCKSVSVDGFGRITNPGIFSFHIWYDYLSDYIKKIELRINSLNVEGRDQIIEYFEKFKIFFNINEVYFKRVKPNLTPVDLNLNNFIVNDDCDIKLIDLESFWGADYLLAYGDWIGNTYGTSLFDCFKSYLGSLSSKEIEVIYSYALLSNLSALVYIAENSKIDIKDTSPWGNPNKYLDLMKSHLSNMGLNFSNNQNSTI